MEQREFRVTGMSCEHCERAVREEVTAVAGVDVLDLNASDGRLVVSLPSRLDDATIIAAVEEAGYEAARVQ